MLPGIYLVQPCILNLLLQCHELYNHIISCIAGKEMSSSWIRQTQKCSFISTFYLRYYSASHEPKSSVFERLHTVCSCMFKLQQQHALLQWHVDVMLIFVTVSLTGYPSTPLPSMGKTGDPPHTPWRPQGNYWLLLYYCNILHCS